MTDAPRWVKVALVVLLTALCVGCGAAFVPPVLRHNGEAEEMLRSYAGVLGSVEPPVRVTESKFDVSSNPHANGGYCWYFLSYDVESTLPSEILSERINDRRRAEQPFPAEVTATSPGRSLVEIEAIAGGGSRDLRCL